MTVGITGLMLRVMHAATIGERVTVPKSLYREIDEGIKESQLYLRATAEFSGYQSKEIQHALSTVRMLGWGDFTDNLIVKGHIFDVMAGNMNAAGSVMGITMGAIYDVLKRIAEECTSDRAKNAAQTALSYYDWQRKLMENVAFGGGGVSGDCVARILAKAQDYAAKGTRLAKWSKLKEAEHSAFIAPVEVAGSSLKPCDDIAEFAERQAALVLAGWANFAVDTTVEIARRLTMPLYQSLIDAMNAVTSAVDTVTTGFDVAMNMVQGILGAIHIRTWAMYVAQYHTYKIKAMCFRRITLLGQMKQYLLAIESLEGRNKDSAFMKRVNMYHRSYYTQLIRIAEKGKGTDDRRWIEGRMNQYVGTLERLIALMSQTQKTEVDPESLRHAYKSAYKVVIEEEPTPGFVDPHPDIKQADKIKRLLESEMVNQSDIDILTDRDINVLYAALESVEGMEEKTIEVIMQELLDENEDWAKMDKTDVEIRIEHAIEKMPQSLKSQVKYTLSGWWERLVDNADELGDGLLYLWYGLAGEDKRKEQHIDAGASMGLGAESLFADHQEHAIKLTYYLNQVLWLYGGAVAFGSKENPNRLPGPYDIYIGLKQDASEMSDHMRIVPKDSESEPPKMFMTNKDEKERLEKARESRRSSDELPKHVGGDLEDWMVRQRSSDVSTLSLLGISGNMTVSLGILRLCAPFINKKDADVDLNIQSNVFNEIETLMKEYGIEAGNLKELQNQLQMTGYAMDYRQMRAESLACLRVASQHARAEERLQGIEGFEKMMQMIDAYQNARNPGTS